MEGTTIYLTKYISDTDGRTYIWGYYSTQEKAEDRVNLIETEFGMVAWVDIEIVY